MEYNEQEQQQQYYQEQLAQSQILQQQSQAKQEQSMIPVSKDRDFMQWLFNLKEQTLEPLRHEWRGEQETDPGVWVLPQKEGDRLRLMNEKGITWCCTLLSKYLQPAFIISNFDETSMNNVMRDVGRVIWNGLTKQYDQFEIKKIDIPTIGKPMMHQIYAIILGARGNGYRSFFMSTHHVDEVKTTQQFNQQKQGFSGFGLFKKKPQMQSMQGSY